MKIKLDENMPRRIEALLAAHGHEVTTVYEEGLVGVPDRVVAAAAAQENAMVITLDRGFPAPATLPATHPGVIVLKLADQSIPAIERAMNHLLGQYPLETLHACVCVVSEHRIRVRRTH